MVNSLTSRPISSVRDQQPSPALTSSVNTPSIRYRSSPSVGLGAKNFEAVSEKSSRSPLLDDRQSSPGSGSLRSSDYSHDRSSVHSFSQRSASTALTAPGFDADRLPPITSLDFPALSPKHSRQSTFDSQTHWSEAKMSAIDKADLASRRSPPPPLRRPGSPAGRISNHSAEWDRHSDRGSPRMPRHPAHPVAVPSASHAYASDYPASPRSSTAIRGPSDPYRDAGYRDAHAAYAHDRESSPTLKRKASSNDLAARRAPMIDRTERVDRAGRPWPDEYAARDPYADRAYYRGRERESSPDRMYPTSYPAHDPAYGGRYMAPPHEEDPRFSPRRGAPPSPSSRHDYRTSGRAAYAYDAPASSLHGYAPRRSDRYSPGPSSTHSPPYAARAGPPPLSSVHEPLGRGAAHSYARRPSPPPYASEGRPHLPPLSSRPPVGAYPAAGHGRYTPPHEAVVRSDSPDLPPHPEPFYPDRRLFFARERIYDPEMDEYYSNSASRVVGKARYPDYAYDAYGSPHSAPYAAGGKNMNGSMSGPSPAPGLPVMRHHEGRPGAYPGSYGPGDYPPHDPRDPHGAMPGGPRGTPGRPLLAVPAAHVPPGPSAGIAPPPRRRGKLPKPVTDLLKSWLLEHASHPYPTEDEKRSLCSMTGLTLSQVSNWFINARRRILLPSGANGSPNISSTAEQVKLAFRTDSPSPEA